MPHYGFSIECSEQINAVKVSSNLFWRNSNMKVTVQSFDVGVVLSFSIHVESAVATGPSEYVGSRVDAASLRPTSHPHKIVSNHICLSPMQLAYVFEIEESSASYGSNSEATFAENRFV